MMLQADHGDTTEESELTPDVPEKQKIFVNLKWRRNDLNVSINDGQPCAKCGFPIFIFTFHNRVMRDNRVDFEDDKENVTSYHLSCYDFEVFGALRHSTMLKILKVRRKVERIMGWKD